MRNSIIAMLVVVTLLGSGCRHRRRESSDEFNMQRCISGLKAIPEMRTLMDSDSQGSQPEPGPHPLQGMQVALTFNRMVRSQASEDAEDHYCSQENSRENFQKIVSTLKENNMPPTVAFVLGRGQDPQLQEEWIRSGNLIGNYSFRPMKAVKWPAQVFIDNIARNDQLLAPLWKKYPPGQKYYRYPRMRLNRDPQEQARITEYLKKSGYTVVPGTIDARDAGFSEIYCAAQTSKNTECSELIRKDFFRLLLDTSLRARAAARAVTGQEAKQILMIEPTQFTIDNLAEIISWFRQNGAQFISVEDALKDPLYSTNMQNGESAAFQVYDQVSSQQRGR